MRIDPIRDTCAEFGVVLIEDAAEALGATYKGRSPGSDGLAGVFSFNGNKIITTSGGGMLVTADGSLAAHVLKLATQARDRAAHYQHSEIGYNYRLSNVLAALGRGQLRALASRVDTRRRHFARYSAALANVPGLDFQPEAPWGTHTRWLTTALVEPGAFGADREALRLALEAENIEARPLWKPMHMQPVFSECEVLGGAVAEMLFARGICLPSGSNLTDEQLNRVCDAVRRAGAERNGPATAGL